MKKFDIGYPLRWILLLSAMICLITGLFGIGDYWLLTDENVNTPLFYPHWFMTWLTYGTVGVESDISDPISL